jgi:hypothetical protein
VLSEEQCTNRLFNVFSCLVMEKVKLGSNKQDSESLGLVGKILWEKG